MNPQTLKALKLSIAHWQRLAGGKSGKNENIGPHYCALCRLFNSPTTQYMARCHGCPVKEKTGIVGCVGTPYDDADRALDELIEDEGLSLTKAKQSMRFRKEAKRELEFLKSLLP